MKKKWQEISSGLDIIRNPELEEAGVGEWVSIWNPEIIEAFEQKHKVHLPHDYKDFITVIGPGVLGDWIHFLEPDVGTLRMSRGWSNSLTKMIENFPSKSQKADQELINLIDNIFIFALVDGPYQGFFDLDTYNEADKSCNIIWSSKAVNDDDEWHFVGRDFFSFFSEFFLDNRLREVMPEDYIRYCEEGLGGDFRIDRTFSPQRSFENI